MPVWIKELLKGTETKKLWPHTGLAWNDTLELFYNYPVLGLNRFSEDIFMMIGRKPNIYFKATWLFVTPALIIVCIYCNLLFGLINGNEESISGRNFVYREL